MSTRNSAIAAERYPAPAYITPVPLCSPVAELPGGDPRPAAVLIPSARLSLRVDGPLGITRPFFFWVFSSGKTPDGLAVPPAPEQVRVGGAVGFELEHPSRTIAAAR